MSRTATSKKSPIQIYLLNLISLAGVGVSVFLTQHFYNVHNGTAGFKSFCNVGEVMNCDVVAASPYSELIFGLPLSSFAGGWFLALFLVSVVAHNAFWRREATRAALAMSGFGVLMAIPYIAVMALKLHTYCLMCFGVDVCSVLALILALSLKPEGFSKHKLDFSKWKVIVPILLGSVVAMVVGLKTLDSDSIPQSDLNEMVDSVLNSPALAISTSNQYPSMGPANAPITVYEFSDFQCPYCRMGAFTINSVLNRYQGQVRVVFRHFPLNQSCNSAIQYTAHPYACEAAKAAVCANLQSKFEPLYQEFFDQQASFGPGRILEIAKSTGLDMSSLQGCMDSPETGSALNKDISEANQLGVKSTPTFFINGHKMEGALPPAVWNTVIERLLNK